MEIVSKKQTKENKKKALTNDMLVQHLFCCFRWQERWTKTLWSSWSRPDVAFQISESTTISLETSNGKIAISLSGMDNNHKLIINKLEVYVGIDLLEWKYVTLSCVFHVSEFWITHQIWKNPVWIEPSTMHWRFGLMLPLWSLRKCTKAMLILWSVLALKVQ